MDLTLGSELDQRQYDNLISDLMRNLTCHLAIKKMSLSGKDAEKMYRYVSMIFIIKKDTKNIISSVFKGK